MGAIKHGEVQSGELIASRHFESILFLRKAGGVLEKVASQEILRAYLIEV